jgi:plastocyanin
MRQLVRGVFAMCMSAAASTPAAAAPAVHRIIISKMAFGASPTPIHAGDVVEWVNEDIFLHSATAQNKSFDVDVAPNKRVQIIIKQSGMFSYICKYHPSMRASLIVLP